MYDDPLHIPRSEYTIVYKGEEKYLLNKRLLDRQNCWENLETIKALHVKKLEIFEEMSKTDDVKALRSWDIKLNELEYELQDAWGFDRDANFFRIWERPKCACPVLDNRDRYPHGHIISGDCPLHGGFDEEK